MVHYNVKTPEAIFEIFQKDFSNRLDSHLAKPIADVPEEGVTKKQMLQISAEAKNVEWHNPRQISAFCKRVGVVARHKFLPEHAELMK